MWACFGTAAWENQGEKGDKLLFHSMPVFSEQVRKKNLPPPERKKPYCDLHQEGESEAHSGKSEWSPQLSTMDRGQVLVKMSW